jgi:hypothetical protein
VYTLKIIGLTQQQDMQTLVKVLLRIPNLDSEKISRGLKFPPLVVISTAQEDQAQKIKALLEKLGAICTVEKAMIASYEKSILIPIKKEKEKNSWGIWLILLAVVVIGGIINHYFNAEKDVQKQKNKPMASVESTEGTGTESAEPSEPAGQKPPTAKEKSVAEETVKAEENAAKSKNELKNDLSKNPYNSSAWKALYEKLESEGDTASASKAKESYDKAVKTQLVLSSLAKAFGNETRVEISEDAVYYRTNKKLTDSEFYYEAEKLRESLNSKFPNKDMVLENYGKENDIQSIRLKAAYVNRAN